MKVRLMGPAAEVADMVAALRACRRLEVAAVSKLLPTREGNRGAGWVRAYVTAAVQAQTGPCHEPTDAVWVGKTAGTDGPLDLWSCRGCGGTWTTLVRAPEASR
jgi:hypothetical protein